MSAGYKNPPEANRFKKGQSGHPSGRPRRAVQRLPAAYLFSKVANEEVTIEVDGREMAMTRWEALTRQVHIMAYNNASASRLLHQIRKEFPDSGSSDVKSILVLSDNEMNY